VSERLLPHVRPVFRAVATTVVPEAQRLDGASWDELERIVEDALADRPERLRRQLRLLIYVIDWLPVLRWGRRFRSLAPARRTRLLGALQNAPFLLLRRGFWGLRTLVLMGYYARPAAAAALGYRADALGWQARR
jgi:hypothetical protein